GKSNRIPSGNDALFPGFRTCVLANHWLDDGEGRIRRARLMDLLRRHFHLVLESCRIGMGQPDPGIYSRALEELQAEPREAILLDEVPENLEQARELGMATILVRDTDTALTELEKLSGLQVGIPGIPLIPGIPEGAGVSRWGFLGFLSFLGFLRELECP
ncbi:bifunctional epoxide hydrolase 2-like, partial [Corapipo altera]|uniref:bifunctional epoxide hydrolase 2-like n=1 Tax=Corapipo altera TaxID=415028 RepID=UPI000FD6A30C